jgi:hypothetical protein
MTQLVAAEKVKGLFTTGTDGAAPTAGERLRPEEAVSVYLRKALDHCLEEADGDLLKHTPPIGCIWPWYGKVLLAYEIRGIEKLPTPVVDMSLPLGQRTKPVRAMFQALLKASLCERPAYPTTLAELRRTEPGKLQADLILRCKEFEDGTWLFMDSSLEA